MKKISVFLILLVLAGGVLSAQIVRGRNAWVAAKSLSVKSSTGFFASTRGTLVYGDQVSILQVKGKWAEIRSAKNSSLEGWAAVSNLSSKRIVVTASTGGASASEISLAGKGFNQEVENAYKTEGDLNYVDVDKTEAINVSQDDLYKFVTEGRLAAGEN